MNTAVKEVQVIKATITGEKTEKIRVAAYCRVSTDKDDQLNSFFAQMRYYRDYVRGNDKMVLVDIYADEGITGTELTKRDEMKRLIRDCRHKKIDRVLVKSVTRFARNSLECIETIRTMQKQLKTLSGIIDETMELAASSTGDGKRFQEEMKSLSSQMVVLREQLEIIKGRIDSNKKVNEEIENIKQCLSADSLDFSEYNDVTIRRLVEYIRVMKDNSIIIVLKGGMKIQENI